MSVFHMIAVSLRALVRDQAGLPTENLALRQQLAVLTERKRRPRLSWRDRVLWVWLSRVWAGWRSCPMVVQPETIVRWHQQGIRLYWRWKSRTRKVGRPKIDAEIRRLIRRMSRDNPGWGVPRIQSEAHGMRDDGAQIPDSASEASVPDLANVPG